MGGHGFMGIRLSGLGYLVASTAFFAYLAKGFAYDCHLDPKHTVPADFAYLAKETQPGIVPEFYIKKK